MSQELLPITADEIRFDVSEESEIEEVVPRKRNRSANNENEKQMYELRNDNLLTDGLILCDNDVYHVHRAVLSANSDYFRAQFCGLNAKLSRSERNRYVHIRGMKAPVLEEVIRFSYLRKCNINLQNIYDLLIAADYVGMPGMITMCKQFLYSIMSMSNCVSVMRFGEQRLMLDVRAKGRDYVLRNFIKIAEVNLDIMRLNVDEFCSLIYDDNLNAREEDSVWKACLNWINFNVTDRKRFVGRLLHGIRLGLVSSKYFMDNIKDHPYTVDNEEAKPILLETCKFISNLHIPYRLPVNKRAKTPHFALPRLPHEIMFAIGGWSGGTSKSVVETYDTRADRWVKVNVDDPAGPRGYHGTAVIGFRIYCIGGYDGNEYFNTCRVFDAVKKSWREIAPMHTRRCYASVSLLNNYIYAVGGFDGSIRLNCVERYNPRTNQWTWIRSVNIQRSDGSACTLDNKVYVLGGFNGTECLDSCECYDPALNVWTEVARMNHRRSGVACVAYNGYIYAVGGFNGTARLSTGERYDPKSNQWTFIKEMTHSRSNFALEVLDEMIFAIGGFNGVSTISSTECYCPENDEWMETTFMNIIRSALSANTIDGLPNKLDYIHKDRSNLMEERRQRILVTAGRTPRT
ncbi:kelch-like protein 10 [Teleopsis dalmanni]|uniref:kelch-like protein 10 n=1 Tax=Teleopsis dalmanni TaxID=139649 RepID=UPI0018CDF4FB|nr:kelch-like protein 10 [Teleopsis dalmanni]XP_037933730.1 kelch-like protein 10 [Teleopsis dalmanni]